MREPSTTENARLQVQQATLRLRAVLAAMNETLAEPETSDFLGLLGAIGEHALTPAAVHELSVLVREFEHQLPSLASLLECEAQLAVD